MEHDERGEMLALGADELVAHKGRGSASNQAGRYLQEAPSRLREDADDGWNTPQEGDWCGAGLAAPAPKTQLFKDRTRRLITTNTSPDISFDQSINPYKGCEHGCIYCFARPTHAYLDLSPGLDFETKIFFKSDSARTPLEAELRPTGHTSAR